VPGLFDRVRTRLDEYVRRGLDVRVVQGDVTTDPLPPEIERIAVCNLDVDMYESIAAGLRRVAPLVVQGGVIVVEDPGHTPGMGGGRLALQEFLETEAARRFVPVYLESGQTFLIAVR
jgi:hypothetical protein